jgi:hypothetical protein
MHAQVQPRKMKRCQPVSDLDEPTDWDTLFNGGIYLCEEGIDYDCPTETFITIVRHKAEQRKVNIKLDAQENGKGFVVQAVL